jgi:predicted dehydrogenase
MTKLRGAIIGYGFVAATGHIPFYQKRRQEFADVEILAVADLCPTRRGQAQEALPQAKSYSDYQTLLAAEASNLDFIDIATPPCDHAAIAYAALNAGLHVLCEKPLTHTTAEAVFLIDRATFLRRVIFPCHNYKHAPIVRAIREIIQSGRIGRVRAVTLHTYRDTHARGVKEWNSDWRRDSRYSGGGIAMDHGSHSFYLAFDWFGSYPTAIKAQMANNGAGNFDTEDNFSAEVTFPNGSAQVHLTWTAGARKIVYRIVGENGMITTTDDELQIETADGGGEVEKKSISSNWSDASHSTWFNALFGDFRAAIEGRDFAGKDAQDALMCVHVINTAYQSARAGCELPLEYPTQNATD